MFSLLGSSVFFIKHDSRNCFLTFVVMVIIMDYLRVKLAQMEDKVPGEQSSYASSSPRGSGRRWSGPPTPSSVEKRCKAAELVLEEVEEKGTLVERVSNLEKRVSKCAHELWF